MAEEPYQHIAHGDGAEQVGNRDYEQACRQHVEGEFTTCDGADAACAAAGSSSPTLAPKKKGVP